MKIKYIVFLILFFATGTTYAQSWNNITGKNSFTDSVRYLKYRHSGNLDSVLTISPTSGNLMFVARSAGGGGYGVDSITITPQGMLCAWASGLSTCYPLGAYYDSSALNSDSSYTYHFSRGVFVDSTYLPKSPIFGGTNLVIRDTTVTVNGNPVRGYIFDASGSGGGGSGSGKVYAGLYLSNVNDSTLKVDSSQVAIKDGFFNPGVIPYSNPLGILTQDYGGLGYDGLNAVIGHNDPSTPTGIRLNGDRAKIQAYLYGLRFQVGITGDSDPTKEYNFYNANHAVPYLRMYTDLNGYYRQHAVFNTDMRIVGLSTDSTAPAQTGVIKYLTVDKTGIVSYGVAAGGVVTDTTTFNWSVLDSLNTPPVSPATGDVYEVGTAGTGAFSGHNKEIATYNGSSYTFEVPVAGNLLYNAATTSVSKYTTVWVRVGKAIIYNGGQIGYGAVTIGTNDNNSLILRTNGATRFSIGNSGNIVANSLAGSGNGFVGISATGLLSKINFPNTVTRYLTGYGTFGSIYDSARQAISVAGTGLSYNATTGVITGSGGGTTPDSSWNAVDVGYPPNAIGTLYETFLNTGSIMSGWSAGSLITPTFTGGKMNVTGGNYWKSPAAAGQPWGSAIMFSTKRMPYEKLDFTTTVIIGSKSAGNIIYVTHSFNGLLYSTSETAAWNLSSDYNSGKFGIGSDTLVTWATSIDSTSKAVFSIGDTVQLYYHKDGWSVTGGINNLTTHKRTGYSFSQIWNGSGGQFNLGFIKGTYGVTNIKFSTWEETGKVWVLGDSHLSGSGASKQSNRYIDLFFKGNSKYYGVWGLPSLSAKYADLSGFATEILADARPTMFINALGYNDKSEGFGAPAFKVYMDSINQKAIRSLGATNVAMISIPPRGTAGDAYNDSLFTLATTEGITISDITTGLKNGLTRAYPPYSWDGVHFNDTGHIKIKNALVPQIGARFLSAMVNDSVKVFKLYGVPTAKAYENSNILVRESDGTVAAIPNTLPTAESVIQNKLTLNTFNYPSTANTVGQIAGIHVTSAIKTDSALEVLTSQGLRIGFSNPLDASNTYATNINIGGLYDGVTNSQTFNSLTGSGIVDITAPSSARPRGTTRVVSGNNNLLLNASTSGTVSGSGNTVLSSQASTLSSGVNNFFAGVGGGKGIATKNSNIDIDIDGSGPSTDVYNTITFGNGATAFNNDIKQDGDVSFNTGVFAPKFWFGGRAPAYSSVSMNAGGANGTNFDGATWNFNVSRSTGLKLPGAMIFNSYAPVATGSTLQSTLIPKFRMGYGGFSYGSTTVTANAADLLIDMQSTTQGFAPPRMTTVQRDAMVAGVQSVTGGGGTGYTNGVIALAFTGGTGTAATAYATISGGVVSTPVLVTRGNYTVAPTGATITSGAGTGASFTITTGATAGSVVYNTTLNSLNAYNGVNWTGDYITSSAGTLTLTHGTDYNFTGTTSTWTLPAVNAALLGRGNMITIKNLGSGAITLNSNAGNTIYTTVAVGTLTINAGDAVTLMPNGTYFLVE